MRYRRDLLKIVWRLSAGALNNLSLTQALA